MNSKLKVLRSAKQLFHRYGIEQTSVDRILSESNVTKSNFYYHFKSKNQLALQVLQNWIDDHQEELLSPTLDNKNYTPGERLAKFYEKITSHHELMKCENGCPFGNTALELSDLKEDFRILLSKHFENWRAKIEHCIKEGIEKNEFRSDLDPAVISELILSHLEGSIMMVKTHKNILPLKRGSVALQNMIKTNKYYQGGNK